MKKLFDLIFVVVIIGLAILLFNHWKEGRTFKAEINQLRMTKGESNYIMKELDRRCADDCALTRTWYGFKCREFKTGKIFKVYM